MAALDFVANLYKELAKGSKNENIFFSPYSISMAMSMVLHGAEAASRSQLVKGLGFENDCDILSEQSKLNSSLNGGDGSVKLRIANKLFPEVSFPVCQRFVSQLKEALGCDVESLDFRTQPEASRVKINDWVEKVTEDKIKDLIPAISPNSVLVLVNAIYFKGMWKEQFEKKWTRMENFYCMDGRVKQVSMMVNKEQFLYNYDPTIKAHSLQIPYKGDHFSMCLFLPESQFGLEEVQQSLTVEQMNKMLDTSSFKEVIVKLPKFSLQYEKMLVDSLKSLGITDIFEKGKANLKGISNAPNLVVSQVIHKAFIEVNEEGTEAAGATGVVLVQFCMLSPPPPLEFTCDHPFIFTIRHNASKEILFFGKIASLGKTKRTSLGTKTPTKSFRHLKRQFLQYFRK